MNIKQIKNLVGRVSESIDFDIKEAFSATDHGWIDLVKDIVCFANRGGGQLIYGVKDKTNEIIGADETTKYQLSEVKNIKQKLDKYVGYDVAISCTMHTIDEKDLLVLSISQSGSHILSFSRDGLYKMPSGEERRSFYSGQVWIRGDGRNELIGASNEQRIVDRILRFERDRILDGITKIVSSPDSYRLVGSEAVGAKNLVFVNDSPGATRVTLDLDATGELWDTDDVTMEVLRGVKRPSASVSPKDIASFLLRNRTSPMLQVKPEALFLLCSKYHDLPKYFLLDGLSELDFSPYAIVKKFIDIMTIPEKASVISCLKVVAPETAKSLLETLKPEEKRARASLAKFTKKQKEDDHSCIYVTDAINAERALEHIYQHLTAVRDGTTSLLTHEAERCAHPTIHHVLC